MHAHTNAHTQIKLRQRAQNMNSFICTGRSRASQHGHACINRETTCIAQKVLSKVRMCMHEHWIHTCRLLALTQTQTTTDTLSNACTLRYQTAQAQIHKPERHCHPHTKCAAVLLHATKWVVVVVFPWRRICQWHLASHVGNMLILLHVTHNLVA